MKRDQTQTQIEIDILQYAKEHTLKPAKRLIENGQIY